MPYAAGLINHIRGRIYEIAYLARTLGLTAHTPVYLPPIPKGAALIPSLTLLLSAEMIRDGGSLAAVFQGKDSAEYWLLLRVRTRNTPEGKLECVGYTTPVWICRNTGQETNLTWPHARALLSQAKGMLREASDGEWLERMADVARTEGALPSGVAQVL